MKLVKNILLGSVLAIVSISLLAGPAMAISAGQGPTDIIGGQNANSNFSSISGWVEILLTVIRWFYTIIFIIAVAFILWSAFDFVTSKGDDTKVKEARQKLMYAVVGIAVALLSYAIVSFVQSSVNSGLAS